MDAMRGTTAGPKRWWALLVAMVASWAVAGALPHATGIVGGSPVPVGTHGFVASLELDGSHFCGGSVISSQWVLTAAHCMTGVSAPSLTVVTGRLARSDESTGQRLGVAEIRVHPQFRRADLSNDVALVRLAAPTSAQAVRLAGPGDDGLEADGTRLTVAGWGTAIFMVPLLPDRLQQTSVAAVSDTRCRALYGPTAILTGSIEPATQVCAGSLLADSCQGDSGGPLFGGSGTGAVVVGVVSWGFVCGLPTNPGVYAEVNAPSIRNWIASQTGL
jgi:secreted trypsin-like serine protease